MNKKLLARLIEDFFRPAVGSTVNLIGNITKVPGGIVADNVGMWGLMGLIQNLESIDWDLGALVSSALAITLTGVQFFNNIIDHSGAPSGGVTTTTPTAAQIIAAMPNTIPGDGYNFPWFYMNDGLGQTVTLTGGSGVTVSGNNTMATNTTRHFLVSVNVNAGTVTIVNMGTVSL